MPTDADRETVLQKIQQSWPSVDPAEILSLLDQYGAESHERDRVQLAILALSEGRRESLPDLVRMAKTDYRDLLAQIELQEARFTPQMTVQHVLSSQKLSIDQLGVAPVVVIAWSRRATQSLAEAVGAQLCEHWLYNERHPLYKGEVEGQVVSFVNAPVGAPGTVAMMEEMIACGARVFLGFGQAGSLQPSAPVGSYLLPAGCIREEGTSFHYLDAGQEVAPDPGLVELILSVAGRQAMSLISAPHWTTDAIYRELVSKISAYRDQGVYGVDMETSAMYALGQFKGVRVCNLLVVSDELWTDWRPAFRSRELRAAEERAEKLILKVLAEGIQ